MEGVRSTDPSLFEVIYRQKLHSASRFENVEYNIAHILDYVNETASSRNEESSVQLTQYHVKNLEPFVENIERDVIFSILSNQEQQSYVVFESNRKYPVNMFLIRKGEKLVHLLICSNQMIHIQTIDVRFIEGVILHQN